MQVQEPPLDEVADKAEQVAADQLAVADQAREMQNQRAQGWSWSQILDRQPSPGIVELLRRSRHHLSTTASTLTAAIAAALSEDGHTRRQIAARLGVTHQRVTAILQRGNGAQNPSND